ncbi:hypothetical protein KP509_22G065300 [Ceratopteris richardii]|uniref:Glucan endo-1,3-beta-D-glucosidase n=1 Tax=Ceratopteris richardii TaxID=49495 RepID=A0A8T2S716_CERRI|nr:hypothetical protein KP509_22G065300 [Ceratopteris richardii]
MALSSDEAPAVLPNTLAPLSWMPSITPTDIKHLIFVGMQVLPAMQNIYAALESMNLHQQVAVSTAHSFSTLKTSYPPSAGAFSDSIANAYMRPVLEFLSRTGSPFLINVYPYFAYKDNPSAVSLEYVLFQDNPGVLDENTQLRYYNMFDAQMDAVYSAISELGFDNITLLVSETGWPSRGDADEPGASVANARLYHDNLVRHVTSMRGTPLRPNVSLDVYLFALFNEDMKPGPTSERNYGLFQPDGTPVYSFRSFRQQQFTSVSSSAVAFSMFHRFPLELGLLYLLIVYVAVY